MPLAADIEADGLLVEFLQHAMREVHVTRGTGLATVNLVVKFAEMSSPLVAISAMSSAGRSADFGPVQSFLLKLKPHEHYGLAS
ncbi:MAG: hypothetical protein ACLPXM_21315 [Terriglobales bacterium]